MEKSPVTEGDSQEPSLPAVRGVTLLSGERVVAMLGGRGALVEAPPAQGPLLALTDRRLLLFTEGEGQEQTVMAPLEHIQGAMVRRSGRSRRPLFQGIALMVVALLAYLLIGTFVVEGLLIPAMVGSLIGLMGLYLVLRYIFWEAEGNIAFQVGGATFSFPYTPGSRDEALTFLGTLFALKPGAVGNPAVAVREDESGPAPWPEATKEAAMPSPCGSEREEEGLAQPGVGEDVQG